LSADESVEQPDILVTHPYPPLPNGFGTSYVGKALSDGGTFRDFVADDPDWEIVEDTELSAINQPFFNKLGYIAQYIIEFGTTTGTPVLNYAFNQPITGDHTMYTQAPLFNGSANPGVLPDVWAPKVFGSSPVSGLEAADPAIPFRTLIKYVGVSPPADGATVNILGESHIAVEDTVTGDIYAMLNIPFSSVRPLEYELTADQNATQVGEVSWKIRQQQDANEVYVSEFGDPVTGNGTRANPFADSVFYLRQLKDAMEAGHTKYGDDVPLVVWVTGSIQVIDDPGDPIPVTNFRNITFRSAGYNSITGSPQDDTVNLVFLNTNGIHDRVITFEGVKAIYGPIAPSNESINSPLGP
jgi:hypothetical protein